jgi:hypothetical protein
MVGSFREMVAHLYNESYEYLWQSLDPEEKEFYESICFNSAPAIIGGTLWNNCPTFWPGNLGRELWYSLMSTRHHIVMLPNVAFLKKCILHILPNYGQD